VLLTVPFGFGVNFVAHIRAKDLLWLVPAVGVGTEAIQFLISLPLRYLYRVVDVNDAILNALGLLIGYVTFRVFARLYRGLIQRFNVKTGGLAAYIQEVASRT
jgi:glycopeptide antibiotics resistance protein